MVSADADVKILIWSAFGSSMAEVAVRAWNHLGPLEPSKMDPVCWRELDSVGSMRCDTPREKIKRQ